MAIISRPIPRPLKTEDDASVQALIDEVDADVKAENLRKFFQRYGNAIAAAVVALIVGVAGVNFYTGWLAQQQEKETATLIQAMNADPATMKDDDLKTMMQALVTLGKDGHGEGIRFAAGVAEVSALQKKGEKDAAIQRLDQLSKEEGLRKTYRDYALLQKIRMQTDGGDAAQLLNQLQPLTAADNPWHVSALELSAILNAKLGKLDIATAALRRILDEQDTPLAAREEASQLLRLYKAM